MASSNHYIYLFVFQVTQQWTHIIDDKYIKSSTKVTVLYIVGNVIHTIEDKLTTSQKGMFSKTYFGAFLIITKFTSSPSLLHNLMYRIVNVPGNSSDEMYFEIDGKLFYYLLRYFAMITGLKYDSLQTTNML